MQSLISHFKIWRILFVVLLSLCLIEAGVRITLFGWAGLHLGHYHNKGLLFTEIPESVDNDVLCYRLKPNLQTYFHGVPFSTNQHGFRDRNVTLRKAIGVKRIAVLGRSVTMGTGVDDEKTYTRRLQSLLDVQFPRQFEVLNFAVGSYRPQQMVELYINYVKDFNIDFIILPILYGELNRQHSDCKKLDDIQPEWHRLRAYIQSSFLYAGLKYYRDQWLKPYLSRDWFSRGRVSTDNTNSKKLTYAHILRQFAADRFREQRPVFLMTLVLPPVTGFQAPVEKYPERSQVLHKWVKNLEGVILLDLGLSLAPKISANDAIYAGDFHPNARVHDLYAQALYQALLPYLEQGVK